MYLCKKKFMSRVNEVKHYNSHPSKIECVEVVKHFTFCSGNVIKYIWRAGIKEEQGIENLDKHIEDLEKAQYYLRQEISLLKNKKEDGSIK